MAFPDAVTQALTGGSPDGGNMNPEAAMSNQAPPTPAPSAPVSGASPTPPASTTPTTPANANVNATPAPERQEAPGEHFRNLSHSLKGAVLAVLAGPQQAVDHYETDDSGKTIAKMRALHPAERLQLMAQAALTGLAAGSRVPPQRSKGAAFAAGIGAGGEAQMDRAQQQDLLKRQQSQQDFELQEKAKTENAIRAMHRATTYSLWQKNMDEQNSHDPERAKNMDIVNAAQDYIQRNPGAGMSVEFVTDQQAKLIHEQEVATLKNDPSHNTKLSVMLPVGMTEAKDQDGNTLHEQDGETPKQVGRIAVIKGGDKMPLPQSFIDDAKEYGTLAGIAGADRLNAGQEIPITQFLSMDARLNQAKQKEIDGWKENKVGENAVSVNGKLVQRNSVSGKTREYGGTPVAVEKEQADIGEKKAGAFQKTKEGEKAAEETKQLQEWDTGGPNGTGRADAFGNPVGAPGMDKKEYLKRVDTYTKDYSKDLNQLDAARSQLSDIINNAEKTKKLPGADAVVGIFDAIGISSAPLKGRGFRINNSVVSEHVEGTRNAWQGMALKLSRLTPDGTGQIVSLEQLKDYERIMDQARQDAYVGAGNDAVNRGIGIQFAPRGNGRPVDANTIDIFLTLAKGDSKRASALLKQYGWTPPEGN